MIGRGLRNSPGKEDCHVIDMVASLEKGIVTTPTLFGLDPQELVKDVDAETMKQMKDRMKNESDREEYAADTSMTLPARMSRHNANITFTHYDNVNTLIENTSGEHHIRTLSHLAWVQADNNRYVLANSSGTFLTLKAQERDFLVTVTQTIQRQPGDEHGKREAPYMRPVVIATTSTFEDAVHAADTYAKKRFVVPWILTNAPWRKARATPEQIVFLNRFREDRKKLEPGSVTKGKAADWITKLKHGARGRLKRMKTENAKIVRDRQKDQKWEELQRREQVKVGPVES